MTATAAIIASVGNTLSYTGGAGTADNDLLIQTGDVSKYDTFTLQSTGGAVDVAVSLDGTHYSTAPLSLTDMGATTAAPVILTAANRTYMFRGKFSKIQVSQNGATAVTECCLTCGNMS